MNNADSIISIFKTCLQFCIAFAILFLVISIVLFFVFDIRAIFSIRTGRAKKKTIKEMQEANNKTGRLRVGGKTMTSQLSKEDKQSINKKSIKTQIASQNIDSQQTEVLQNDNYQTEVLGKEEYIYGSAPTSQLNEKSNDNSLQVNDIHFVITKNIVVVNTDEMI